MIWCSGWKLASAVSNAGGLGLIGAGSMHPETLLTHIKKCRAATDKPFGVNVPLLYPQSDEIIDLIIDQGVKIVFTSAGNPAKYTAKLKENGITVVHVVANKKFAVKAQDAGVDAIVAEGFEAGGHNGFEETTTLVLIPMLKEIIDIPIIAAGGIGSGQAMYAAKALGAEGFQVGSLFAACSESSAHENFKQAVIDAGDGETYLTLKKVVPVRLIRNDFFNRIHTAGLEGKNREELQEIIGQAVAEQLANFNPQNPKPKHGKYLTRNEAAEKLRISLPTLNKLTRSGKLHGYRVGNRVVYHSDELDEAIR